MEKREHYNWSRMTEGSNPTRKKQTDSYSTIRTAQKGRGMTMGTKRIKG